MKGERRRGGGGREEEKQDGVEEVRIRKEMREKREQSNSIGNQVSTGFT